VSAELKHVIDELGRTFEAFKAEHKQQLDELRKGVKDALQEEKIVSIQKKLDELQAKKDELDRKAKAQAEADQKRMDELEKKLNRPGFGGGENDEEVKHLAAFNQQIKALARERGDAQPADASVEQYRAYKSGLITFFRKGEKHLTDDERKAMMVGVDADGGYLVTPDMSGRMVTRLFDLSPIRQIANVQVISSDRLEGMEDLDEAAAGWVGETAARTDTDNPQVGKYEIPAHEMYAQPKATQKLLDDSAVDIESWLSGKVSDRFARLEGAAFVTGDGIAKPRGFTSYSTAATADASRPWGTLEHINTGVNGAFAATNPADVLFELEGAFKPGYLQNASWVTRRSVITLVRKFKGSDNNYLWQPGLAAGKPATLIGYPIVMAEDMPTLASGSLSMALGNFQLGYQIVDRLGIRVLRDPYTDKPYVKFYTTKRTGGAVVQFEAIKFVRFGT
jgi:HK97 family phage major capsid protein